MLCATLKIAVENIQKTAQYPSICLKQPKKLPIVGDTRE